MSTNYLKAKSKWKNWVKYFIFNFVLFGAFFAMQIGGVQILRAEETAVTSASFKLHQSNHSGNNSGGSTDAYDVVTELGTGYHSNWYIQGTGVHMKDIVTMTLTVPYNKINGIIAFESNYTGANNRNYDAYIKESDSSGNYVWKSISEGGTKIGKVLDSGSCGSFETTAASLLNTDLNKANEADRFYSYLCITETENVKIEIKYAYTIRNAGYGDKYIKFVLYNDDAYDPTNGNVNGQAVAYDYDVNFVVAKPVNENDFTWVDAADTECGTNASATGRPTTNNICVNYINSTTTNQAKTLTVVLPKETAYYHDVAIERDSSKNNAIKINSITDNTIYAKNNFYNDPSDTSVSVLYYYYDFKLVSNASDSSGSGNSTMNTSDEYIITLSVDASGNYTFTITDIFGNVYTSTTSVGVADVLKTNIIVDYTNEQNLTIMKVTTSAYASDDWKKEWQFVINEGEVDFKKIAKDEITVEVHLFHKVVIANGVFGGNGTDGSETTDIEDIEKQPLGYKDGGAAGNNPNQFGDGSIVIWRVDKVADDEAGDTNFASSTENHVSCGTDATNLCSASNLSVGNVGTYTSADRKNKITFTVKSNGRYRIMVTDNFSNTTNSLTEDKKNPSVEVSVIDRYAPVVGYENGNTEDGVLTKSAYTNTIYSHDYVIGGGKIDPTIPTELTDKYWQNASSYTTIYYNSKGGKAFDYQDALEIAKVKVLDPVYSYVQTNVDSYFANYNVNFGYAASTCANVVAGTTGNAIAAGVYCDPSAGAKSDRNSSGTAYNLHSYVISNNLMSFSAGLIIRSNETDFESTTYSNVTGTAPTKYVVAEGNDFAGYLSIEFKNSSGSLICTVEMDSDKSAGSLTNQKCFSLMNQYIDDVENFSMTFKARDYMYDTANSKDSYMHESDAYVVNVKVVDNTAPGIDKESSNPIEYSNENTVCRLEIDNVIQLKAALLECYKITSGETYYIKDNNVNHAASGVDLTDGEQFYNLTDTDTNYSRDYYHSKIVISVLEEGIWSEISDTKSSNPTLVKSGYHQFKVEIYDHWEDVHGESDVSENDDYKDHNVLTIYVTYYVNPRTLLIEPLIGEKMYGELEPIFDYCVYVNNNNDTFNLEGKFFDVHFINEYFTNIYCTKDVYAPIDSNNRYSQKAGTESLGYEYHTYEKKTDGDYLLVNNTYVKIENSKKYTMSYVESATGEFVKKDSNYYEIKSGFVYTNDSCLYAVTDGTVEGKYLKTSVGCIKIVGSGEGKNRYTEKYTQDNSGTYLKYNNGNTVSADGYDNVSGTANDALVNSNIFTGKLARVESRCYNIFADNYYSNFEVENFASYVACDENSTAAGKAIRNDNVGQYPIVLGTLAIKEDSGTKYNEDYVIKLNTNYVAATYALGGNQTIVKVKPGGSVLVDDGLKTESTVNFTIRQAVLTISADGSHKRYAEQDPYSNNWNNTTTSINSGLTGYLGGYTVHGWRYNGNKDDTENYKLNESDTTFKSIILGTLRRSVGENVGVYDICNISSNPSQMNLTNCTSEVATPLAYDSNYIYYFAEYDHYLAGGFTSTATGAVLPALTINTNGEIYGNATGRTLNTGTKNYAIVFIKNNFEIRATDLIIQPGINQGKEYAETEYNDPLWSLVVYGENVTLNTTTDKWESIIEAADETTFSGYTETITLDKNTVAPQRGTSPYEGDSEVYYARRKTSPDTTYQYVKYINIGAGVQKYLADGSFYYESTTDAVSAGTTNLYVFAYGKYYQITDADRCVSPNGDSSSSGSYLKIVIDGRLVNQEDNLFSADFVLERVSGGAVGWYSYVALNNYKLDEDNTTVKYYTIKSNGRAQCAISADTVSLNISTATECRNYNVVYVKNAPTSIMSGETITGYQTEEGTTPVYKPNGVDECTSATAYSSPCGSGNSTEITFEIFKREIILEFIDDNYTFIYGERYDYYDGGKYNESDVYQYNANTNGIFHIDDATSERNIFLCYSDLGEYLADCTTDPDYGLTLGHTWTEIGLEFHLHSIVSALNSGYYSTSSDKAVPAGEYYVYASISAAASLNYKFTYRGGTLKINPKVTNVQLTGYTMEYGESQYESYGIGTNYSEYTSYKNTLCMNNLSYKVDATSGNIKEGLITDCSETGNVVGNTYGFVIEGLDDKDTIATNFTGRPVRVGNNANNVGVYDDVGYYKIGVGNIANINDANIKIAQFKECATNVDSNGVVNTTDCVFVKTTAADVTNDVYVTGDNAKNYDITYSLNNNEGSYLFIIPASVDVTVYENQTKMYGCAYVDYKNDPTYYSTYSYDNGYANCVVTSGTQFDLAYRYTVTGDKDVGSVEYDVGTSTANGDRVFYEKGTNTAIARDKSILTDDRLYRVSYSSTVSYKTAKEVYEKYQGQAVGVYTITLGKLDIVGNSNALMCDNYNNPVLDGGKSCRNYNINYYGESTTVEKDNHTYSDQDEVVNVNNLSLYVLNYVATDVVSEAEYVYINGKYVDLKSVKKYKLNGTTYEEDASGEYILVENFATIASLSAVRYNKQTEYVKSTSCGSDCYIYLDGYKKLSEVTKYVLSEGNYIENASGTHLKVTKGTRVNYIELDAFVTFAKGNIYVQNDAGAYVYINDEYVQLSSLNKYTYDTTTKLYTKNNTTGTYVQICEYKALSSLDKYKLDANSKFKLVVGPTDENTNRDSNVFVFINGSYVPYNAVVTSSSQTTVTVNSANVTTTVSGTTTNSEVRGTSATDVKFTITSRIVYVHPEYNIKPYGDVDPVEYITCKEIKNAYMGEQTDGRGYCANYNDYDPKDNAKQGAHIDLGVTMYYAVQNSLAKAPWTEWTDYVDSTTKQQTRSGYNDIQFDVLTGKISRRFDSTNSSDIANGAKTDRAGKYTFDFGNVTTYDDYSGENYLIQYVTKNYTGGTGILTGDDAYSDTYVKLTTGSYKKLNELLFAECTYDSDHCIAETSAKGKTIKNNSFTLKVDSNGNVVEDGSSGTATAISLIQKYYHNGTSYVNIDYWYLGFYKNDEGEGRNGELAVWWSDEDRMSSDTSKNPFNTSYDTFKPNNDSVAKTIDNGVTTYNYFTSISREVYFEIVRRTIYLYAVDVEKIYGEADKYSDFLVAICSNTDGYVKAANGDVTCKSDAADYAKGLSDTDKAKFIQAGGVMNQWKIKNKGVSTGSDYIFQGQTDLYDSFGIYFRRTEGENAGSYTLTACAVQSDVKDCTHKPATLSPNYTIEFLGDNYTIVEVPGVLTIKTRVVDITPDVGQGFTYGNYTENGSMPNITFKETHDNDNNSTTDAVAGLVYGSSGVYLFDNTPAQIAQITSVLDADDKTTSLYTFTIPAGKANEGTYIIDGVHVINSSTNARVATVTVTEASGKNTKNITIDTTTYTIVQKARCLISISGLSTICISDAQNESLANSLGENYYEYGVTYEQSLETKVCDGVCDSPSDEDWKVIEDITKEYYSYNVYADDYSNPAKAHTRTEVASGRSALNMDCGDNEDIRYSRDVCSYNITKGDLAISSGVTTSRTVYVYVTNARRYARSGEEGSYTYTQSDSGTWVKYGEGLYAEYDATKLVAYVCDDDGLNCKYEAQTGDAASNNKYLPVVVTVSNYAIGDFDNTKTFVISKAAIEVTPDEKQNKIYGEADIEIKFTIVVEYTAERTHYQNYTNSNIIKMCNGATCYSGNDLNNYRYNFASGVYTQNAGGSYILLTKGWVVTLDSFAYDEENETNSSNHLDYGVNFASQKHTTTTTELEQNNTSIVHYDKYTSYKSEITTERILLGNLYVAELNENDTIKTSHVQTVGEKPIVNGMKIATNNLGGTNYNLSFVSKKFVIVPRPVNVSIANITKTYGQATDSESCDDKYVTECVVGDGILTAEDNRSLLINNYNVLAEKDVAKVINSVSPSYSAGVNVVTTTYTDGITVVYMSSNTDYSKMNMPTVTSGTIDTNYTDYVTATSNSYYTATGSQEKKNDTLNIKVERKAETTATGDGTNVARNNAECMFNGDKNGYCEDVGEYYLYFNVRDGAKTKESTVASAYYDEYWGYNPNYYVIVYNNFEASGWSGSESYTAITADVNLHTYSENNVLPGQSATLKIRKRPVQIVVETISEYTYTQSDTGTHLRTGTEGAYKYHRITDTNTYLLSGTVYVQSKMTDTTKTYYLCTYGQVNAGSNCTEITAANRFNIESKTVGEKYSIEQNMDVPELLGVANEKSVHHTTYENITWYEHPLQVRSGDNLYGKVAYCSNTYTLTDSYKLDDIRSISSGCPASAKLHYYDSNINTEGTDNFFNTINNGAYIITREANVLYIRSGENTGGVYKVADGTYEANNYTTTFVNGVLQIDLDETPPVINIETDFIIQEANGGNMSGGTAGDVLSFLDALVTNGCANLTSTRNVTADANTPNTCDNVVFTYENGTNKDETGANKPTVSYDSMKTLLEWFGITSFDPGIIRANAEVENKDRYHARWYMAIQADFNQKKTGNYTLFIYVQDDVGNISLATTVTLRVVDTTKPTVGTLNLYSAKVKCDNGLDCTNEDNWTVAEDIYLPISALSADNISNMKEADKATKYMYTTNGSGVYGYHANNNFGTYYKITVGTSAKAVKHDGWINSSAGIYMTVTSGDDNSLTYLDISGYTKYNISGDVITENGNGANILLGSFINVDNLTKYREVVLKSCTISGESVNCENTTSGASGTKVYMPDKTGTIIRYKGYYYDLASGSYIGTAPTGEYALNLYSYKNGTYTKATTIPDDRDGHTYHIRDGEMYELPSERYNVERKHGTGEGYTYINFAQWDHYYSRDGGNTWAKYSRDAQSGYLALGEDGQRLIMIKAVDTGFSYNGTVVSKDHITDAYCKDVGDKTCKEWWGVDVGKITVKDGSNNPIEYKEYIGNKILGYKVSDWAPYTEGTQNRDAKYAYLDTIFPHIELTDDFTDIFEYGCTTVANCNKVYDEKFGNGIDGYVYDLNKLNKYSSSGGVGSTHVRINGNLIEIVGSRRYKFDNGALVQDNEGSYIYLGNTDTVLSSVANKALNAGSASITGNVEVYDKNSCSGEPVSCKVTVTLGTVGDVTGEARNNLASNTKQTQSGVGQGENTMFDGVGNTDQTFGVTSSQIDDKYVQVYIYADVHGGVSNAAIAGHPHLSAQGYYKFIIKVEASKYNVYSCYSSSSSYGEQSWCSTPSEAVSYDTMKDAIDAIVKVYKAADGDTDNTYNFNGNDIIFTMDYRVFDLAGNASYYERKLIMLYSFTRTIGADDGSGAAVASLSVEVPQNVNVMDMLSNFNIVTTTGKNLRTEERILQSVYYNGVLVSSRAVYDLQALGTLDTTVPGNYKIVYTIERKDGATYAVGNSVELNITVVPDIADVDNSTFNYGYILAALCGIITLGLIGLFLNKRKQIL